MSSGYITNDVAQSSQETGLLSGTSLKILQTCFAVFSISNSYILFSKYSIKPRLCALNFSSCNKNLDKSDLTRVIYAKGYGTTEVSFKAIMTFALTIMVFLMSIPGLFSSQVEESKSEDENQEEEWSTKERSQLLEMTKRLKEANDAIGYMIEAVEWNSDGQIFLSHVMIIVYLQKWHRGFGWLVGWLVARNKFL